MNVKEGYDSPIKIIQQEIATQLDGEIMKCIQKYGIDVDKEELIKALNYDREQFDTGNKVGYIKGITDFYYQIKRFENKEHNIIVPASTILSILIQLNNSVGEKMMVNKDDLTEAVHGLDIFTKNWCMNCEETEKQNDLIFRCDECPFSEKDGRCLIKKFAFENRNEHKYPMRNFGCMRW